MSDTIYLRGDRTIEQIKGGYAVYNDQGQHYRIFYNIEDAMEFLETGNDELVMHEGEEDYWIDKEGGVYAGETPLDKDFCSFREWRKGLRRMYRLTEYIVPEVQISQNLRGAEVPL